MPKSESSCVADEKVALEDGAAILREGRAGDGEAGAERGEQGIGDRPDIALVGRIEGRAVFEEICRAPAGRSQASAASDCSIASAAGMVRDFSATTTASLSGTAIRAAARR